MEITSTAKECYGGSDGTVCLKVGPGGKLSNINKRFADFKTHPPPPHTAFRDNTAHHFARLQFTADSVRVRIIAVLRGRQTWVQDEFRYTLGACPAQ